MLYNYTSFLSARYDRLGLVDRNIVWAGYHLSPMQYFAPNSLLGVPLISTIAFLLDGYPFK